MHTNKTGIQDLVYLLNSHGIRNVVVSPGSRNAPVSVELNNHPTIRSVVVPDERVAAFFALGLAQQLRQPVAICCTSGSALLNYAPAVTEAYYRRIPLLVISADRPQAWIDQLDGQTIRQSNVYQSHIRFEATLREEPLDDERRWHNQRLINEACQKLTYPIPGPVHLNVPLREPLYGTTEKPANPVPEPIKQPHPFLQFSEVLWEGLQETFKAAEKIMILAGTGDNVPTRALTALSEMPQVIVVAETTANIPPEIPHISPDIVLSSSSHLPPAPDLLITFGGQVISKRIKQWLRSQKIAAHWHIDPAGELVDTYQHLSQHLPLEPGTALRELANRGSAQANSTFRQDWLALGAEAKKTSSIFAKEAIWSDWLAYHTIFTQLPENCRIHLGNSAPVRYAQFFTPPNGSKTYCNRGTSGIDGCLSTACGAAFADPKKLHFAILGDVAFFYDSNALWHNHLPNNLRVIVINNQGGGIFRLIDGPSSTDIMEKFQEMRHVFKAKPLAISLGVESQEARNPEELDKCLRWLLNPEANQAMLLEVATPPEKNDAVYSKFIQELGK